jgi:hypothetical protein
MPLLQGIGTTTKIIAAIDGDGKGSKHWSMGHDVTTPDQARAVAGAWERDDKCGTEREEG